MRRANPTQGVRLPPQKEISLHVSAAAFMRRALPPEIVFAHVPNGEVRDKATAGKLWAMGVLAGFADFVLIMPVNGQAAFLELKSKAGVLSDAQVEFKRRVEANNCGYATARTMEEVEAILARWCAAYGLKLRATLMPRRAA